MLYVYCCKVLGESWVSCFPVLFLTQTSLSMVHCGHVQHPLALLSTSCSHQHPSSQIVLSFSCLPLLSLWFPRPHSVYLSLHVLTITMTMSHPGHSIPPHFSPRFCPCGFFHSISHISWALEELMYMYWVLRTQICIIFSTSAGCESWLWPSSTVVFSQAEGCILLWKGAF